MASPITVFPVGSYVKVHDLTVQVAAVNITGGGVRYQCVWWNGRTRNSEWFEDFEVRARDTGANYAQIGFHLTPEETSTRLEEHGCEKATKSS